MAGWSGAGGGAGAPGDRRARYALWISKTIEGLSGALAYCKATWRSNVVDMNAHSTPPRTPCSFALRSLSGSTPPDTPRYTLATLVSLDALTIAELIAWIVVTYRLPLHPARAGPNPRSVSLYLANLHRGSSRSVSRRAPPLAVATSSY